MEPLEGEEDLNRYGCSGKKHMNLNRQNLGEYGICIAHCYSFMHNSLLVLLPLLSLHFKKSPYLLFNFSKLHICLHPLSQVRDALQKCDDFKHYIPGDHIGNITHAGSDIGACRMFPGPWVQLWSVREETRTEAQAENYLKIGPFVISNMRLPIFLFP